MILRNMLKSKIHMATVTEAIVDYEGSIKIDKRIMDAVDISENEQVDVLSISTGTRLQTYAIGSSAGSGQIGINGAAAKLISPGETIIILSYAQVPEDQIRKFSPKVAVLNERNEIKEIKKDGVALDVC